MMHWQSWIRLMMIIHHYHPNYSMKLINNQQSNLQLQHMLYLNKNKKLLLKLNDRVLLMSMLDSGVYIRSLIYTSMHAHALIQHDTA